MAQAPRAHWAHILAPPLTPALVPSWEKDEGLLLSSLPGPGERKAVTQVSGRPRP